MRHYPQSISLKLHIRYVVIAVKYLLTSCWINHSLILNCSCTFVKYSLQLKKGKKLTHKDFSKIKRVWCKIRDHDDKPSSAVNPNDPRLHHLPKRVKCRSGLRCELDPIRHECLSQCYCHLNSIVTDYHTGPT